MKKKILKKQKTIKFIEKNLYKCDRFLVACKNGMLMHRDDEEKLQNLIDRLLIKNIEFCFTNIFDRKAYNINLIFCLSKNILEKQNKYYSIIDKKNNLYGINFQQKDYHFTTKNKSIVNITYNCHDKNLNYVIRMRIVLEEIRPLYNEIDDLKTETKEILFKL
ncbi:hypothetical protein GVAV_003582 [Gurleya vavrai]